MRKKANNKATAPGARKGPDRGTKQAGPRRERNPREGASAPRIVAGSLYDLKVTDRMSFDVDNDLKGKKRSLDGYDYDKIYDELFPVCVHLVREMTGEETRYNPKKDGMDMAFCFSYMMNMVKRNAVPTDFSLRIDQAYNKAVFTIYDWCQFNDWWHPFEIMPVVRSLENNPTLLRTFISFMAMFSCRLKIDPWYRGGLGYADYMVDEHLECWEDYIGDVDSEESFTDFLNTFLCIRDYEIGEADHYRKELKKLWSPQNRTLEQIIQKLDGAHPVIPWMKEALEFLKKPGDLCRFVYPQLFEEERDCGVLFDQMSALIWDWDDPFTRLHMEGLDAEFQGYGSFEPVAFLHLSTQTTKKEIEYLRELKAWPGLFSHLWNKYSDITQKLRKNGFN